MKRTVSLFLAILFTIGLSIYPVAESAPSDTSDDSGEILLSGEYKNDYEEYLENGAVKLSGTETYEFDAEAFLLDNAEKTDLGVKMSEEGSKLSFSSDIAEGRYNIKISYRQFGESSNNILLSLKIDGEYPFSDCQELSLFRMWQDKTKKPQKDKNGNEFSPEQVALKEFRSSYLTDITGVIVDPYQFLLTEGNHTFEIELIEGSLEIETIAIEPIKTVKTYKETQEEYKDNGYKWYQGEKVKIEGETAKIKSAKSIISKSDNSTSNITPSSPYKNVLNNIGGDNWASPGQSIVWTVDVKKSGIYKFNFRYQQRGVINGVTYRQLRIDGETPFSDAKAISFPYTTGWSNKTLQSDDGTEYGIYLSKGEHEIELLCTLGPVSDMYKGLQKTVSSIGDRYIQIIMITGETPDPNRDYELFKQIPDFNKSLESDRKALLNLANYSEKISGSNGNQAAASFRNMARVLDNMINDKYNAHKYVSDYYTNYNAISAWLSDLRSMPLSIDSIELSSKDEDTNREVSGFFESILFAIKRFLYSFVRDYSSNDEDSELRIWVNWGRDQAQVLNSLIENKFTPKTGIKVKLEVVSTSVINGIISGNAPDLTLHSTRSTPVNLAMRGALVELSKYDDFDEVMTRFQKTAADPYYYNGKCYALPDTQTFMVMFYRKDVLDKLEISVPQTWDEFTDATTKILRNNMQVYMPYVRMNGTTVADAGVGSLSLFPTLLIQNNVNIYNDAKNKCNLASSKAISVFADWTEYYTEYKLLKEANFYNRFRLGTMPLGISTYTLYTQILTAAPEISGKWGIALLPGTKNPDGTVNHSASGAGTGASILKVSEHQDEAWEFIKWWTESETQFLYSENLECVLGPTGRQTTSNIEAFSNMSWSKKDKEILVEQWNNVVEIPEVPGSYYLSRSIDQAYWEVMNGKNTPKEALIKWSDVANAEIKRKIKEYS